MPKSQDGSIRKRSRLRAGKKLVLMGLIASVISPVQGQIQDQAVANQPIDFSEAGQVAIVGDYDGLSYYSYASQLSSGNSLENSSDRLLWQAPDGHIIPWNQTDGSINSICNIDNTIFFGGNFSRVGSLTTSPNIAAIQFENGSLQALDSGLPAGQVNTLYCDQTQKLVYIGGNFTFENTTNAAIWNVSSQSFGTLPFGGFLDGVVDSIAPFNGSVIFAGNFTRLGRDYQSVSTTNSTNYTSDVANGNASQATDSETMVPFGSANVSATGSSADSRYSDPASILCSQDSNNWLLSSGSQGTWQASLPFDFQPTKLRLRNAAVDNYGTQIFRYISADDGGIMNLTYTDSNGDLKYCDAWCTLESYTDNNDFIDFNFVNNAVSMSGFRLEFFGYYGQAAGLSGLEIYQNQSISYAVESMNTPLSCQKSAAPTNFSTISTIGSWYQPTLLDGEPASYLMATAQSADDELSVTYFPVTPYSGNYTVLVYTPGCQDDGSCGQRGTVNVTLNFSPNETAISQTLAQSNEYLKFDIIYQGPIYIDNGFVPNLTVSVVSDQTTTYPETVVAQSIGVQLNAIFDQKERNITTQQPFYFGGIFEYLPSNFTVNNLNTSVGNTTINSLGYLLDNGSEISSLASANNNLFVGGSYRGENLSSNFMIINNSSGIMTLPSSDLNGSISSLLYDNSSSSLVITGNFSGSAFGISNISNIVGYSVENDTWSSFDGGIDYVVDNAVSLKFNISNVSHFAIGFVNNSSGLDESAIWLSDSSEWLNSAKGDVPLIAGQLHSGLLLNEYNLLAGQLASSGLAASSVAFLGSNQTLSSLPVTIRSPRTSQVSSTVSLRRRDTYDLLNPDLAVLTSAFYNRSDGEILTIYGGHFSAIANDVEYNNLVIFGNDSSALAIANVSSDQYNMSESNVVRSLFVHNKTLHAGGNIVGSYGQQSIHGLIMFDLEQMAISTQQVPGLSGSGNVQVNAITARPNTNQIVVGGIFDHAGSLDCPGVCVYDWDNLRWQSAFYGLSGNVSTISFIDANTALVTGNLSANGTHVYVLSYNLANGKVTNFGNTTTSLPGPVDLALVGQSGTKSIIVSGQTQSNVQNSFLYSWDGDNWSNIGYGLEVNSILTDLHLVNTSTSHKEYVSSIDGNELLLVAGSLNITGQGVASAATYDGNAWNPFLVARDQDGSTGVIYAVSMQNSPPGLPTKPMRKYLGRGWIVLIGLAISLFIMSMIIICGILASYFRRRHQGYQIASSSSDYFKDIDGDGHTLVSQKG